MTPVDWPRPAPLGPPTGDPEAGRRRLLGVVALMTRGDPAAREIGAPTAPTSVAAIPSGIVARPSPSVTAIP